MELIWCPPGSFTMGSPTSEQGRNDDEAQHPVTLTKGFWLGKYEVTQRQWESVMGNNPARIQKTDHPVEQVSWEDCQAFIRAVHRANPELAVRLPTEAEWEYACRAGEASEWGRRSDGTVETLDVMGWYGKNSGYQTHPVGQKESNALGLYDMHGNVEEWCSDSYGYKYYSNSPQIDPQGPSAYVYQRVVRGGSYCDSAKGCRSARRNKHLSSSDRYDYLGFRLCCSAGPRD